MKNSSVDARQLETTEVRTAGGTGIFDQGNVTTMTRGGDPGCLIEMGDRLVWVEDAPVYEETE